jgi:hypothetical protein
MIKGVGSNDDVGFEKNAKRFFQTLTSHVFCPGAGQLLELWLEAFLSNSSCYHLHPPPAPHTFVCTEECPKREGRKRTIGVFVPLCGTKTPNPLGFAPFPLWEGGGKGLSAR